MWTSLLKNNVNKVNYFVNVNVCVKLIIIVNLMFIFLRGLVRILLIVK